MKVLILIPTVIVLIILYIYPLVTISLLILLSVIVTFYGLFESFIIDISKDFNS